MRLRAGVIHAAVLRVAQGREARKRIGHGRMKRAEQGVGASEGKP